MEAEEADFDVESEEHVESEAETAEELLHEDEFEAPPVDELRAEPRWASEEPAVCDAAERRPEEAPLLEEEAEQGRSCSRRRRLAGLVELLRQSSEVEGLWKAYCQGAAMPSRWGRGPRSRNTSASTENPALLPASCLDRFLENCFPEGFGGGLAQMLMAGCRRRAALTAGPGPLAADP
eukprot:CAMPEP_0180741366 /NCGR_PEP_ID=MMETSP1038_2-20121128/26366_1 /TAXON_ID=632150 /ORGANISM="Azadinium spinosum, Strain 3D9" /LENGTH=178 /DNA_ID=CAMNT_0022774691 /DNA_START=9 /DNA_END=542 /DNA_ORIENTATION=+